jgi:Tfp pilus assembly protein PilX
MRLRTLLLIGLILLIASFVALNVESIFQPTTLNLGVASVQAPLGLVLLGLLVVLLLVFLLALVYFQASHLMEVRRITREAAEQRTLADKAEASRFIELREFLRTELAATAARDAELSSQLVGKMDAVRAALAMTIEQTGNGISASLGELEDRLDRQWPPGEGRG